jgi:hypothetical protein
MSISPIASNNSAITTTQISGLAPVSSASQDADGDNGGSRVSSASSRGGKFASAISQALQQLGVGVPSTDSTSGASGTTSTQDPKQALASFMQNLFAALQSQKGTSAAASTGSASGAVSSVSGAGSSADGASAAPAAAHNGHHHHGGGAMSKLESGLQSLEQQLSSSSDQSASGSSSSNPSLDALQQSFNNLLSVDGTSGSNPTLSAFLQSLSQNLHGAPATGNVVTAKA